MLITALESGYRRTSFTYIETLFPSHCWRIRPFPQLGFRPIHRHILLLSFPCFLLLSFLLSMSVECGRPFLLFEGRWFGLNPEFPFPKALGDDKSGPSGWIEPGIGYSARSYFIERACLWLRSGALGLVSCPQSRSI